MTESFAVVFPPGLPFPPHFIVRNRLLLCLQLSQSRLHSKWLLPSRRHIQEKTIDGIGTSVTRSLSKNAYTQDMFEAQVHLFERGQITLGNSPLIAISPTTK